MKGAMSRGGVDAAKRNRVCRPRAGWSLIEVVVTTAIVGTLGVAIVTSMTHEVASSQRNQCKANLEMIEAAIPYLLRGTPEQVDRRFELLRRQNDERNRRMLEGIARTRDNP